MLNLYMAIDFIGGVLKELHNKGVSWGAVLTALLLWNKMNRNKRLREHDERTESKLDALLQERGIVWNGQAKISRKDLMNYKQLQQSYSVGISQVGFLFRRRGRRMNKAWIISLVVYVLGQITTKWGVRFPDETANWIVDGFLMLLPLVFAFANKTKTTPQPAVTPDTPLETPYQDPQAANHSH